MAQKLSEQGVGQAQANQALAQMGGQQQQQARPVGTIKEEAVMMVTDIFEAFKDALGLKRPPKTPEEQAKLQQFHQKWQGLDMEQQQVAQMRIQQEMQRKQMQEQEDAMRAQQEAQSKQQGFSMPGGKVSGQGALDKMQQDRKGMGGASG